MQTELKRTRLLEEPVRTRFSQLSRDEAAILYTNTHVMWAGHVLAIGGREERRKRRGVEGGSGLGVWGSLLTHLAPTTANRDAPLLFEKVSKVFYATFTTIWGWMRAHLAQRQH